jgi:formate dehydrogenase major subunit
MKEDRDKNFISRNKDGQLVNRWATTGFLAASARPTDCLTTYKWYAAGNCRFDNQASLTRPDGSQSGSDVWPWCDDELLDRHQNTDLVVIMGGNAAEAHPCGFKWVTEAKHYNKAMLIVVDPRFTRSAAMADLFMQLRPGTDIAWLGGVINYLLSNDKIQRDYVLNYTNASFIVKDEFSFRTGCLAATTPKRDYDRSSWDYVIGERLRHGRSDAAEPTLRLPADEGALFALHAGDGGAHHRGAQGQVPEGLRVDRRDGGTRQGDDQHVRPGLDAAFEGLAEHPHDGDHPAPARQHRRCRRRHERLAWPLQHQG